jgi:hypothetical protein
MWYYWFYSSSAPSFQDLKTVLSKINSIALRTFAISPATMVPLLTLFLSGFFITEKPHQNKPTTGIPVKVLCNKQRKTSPGVHEKSPVATGALATGASASA